MAWSLSTFYFLILYFLRARERPSGLVTMSHYSGCTLVLIAVAQVAAGQATPAESRQSPSFSIEDVLSAPFPTALRALQSTGRLAWVFNADGSRNVWMADRGPTGSYLARALTNYTGDDGIEITELAWRSDGEGVVYVRGGAANPLSLVHPSEPSRVWTISVKNGSPRLIGDGQGVTVSPKGDRVAYIASNGIVVARLDSTPSKEMTIRVRGGANELTWSPDGARLAFSSARGDHSLIGLYDVGAQSVRWLGPGVDRDLNPVWSPDSRQVAFIRTPGGEQRSFFEGTGETTWAIWVADASTGTARELWHADPGQGSEVHDLEGESAFAWGAGNRVLFRGKRRAGCTCIASAPVRMPTAPNRRTSRPVRSRSSARISPPIVAASCTRQIREISTTATFGRCRSPVERPYSSRPATAWKTCRWRPMVGPLRCSTAMLATRCIPQSSAPPVRCRTSQPRPSPRDSPPRSSSCPRW